MKSFSVIKTLTPAYTLFLFRMQEEEEKKRKGERVRGCEGCSLFIVHCPVGFYHQCPVPENLIGNSYNAYQRI
jgi:hypothetical protein